MGLHEEALELRKKICATAPEIYKQELAGKPWEVAVLNAAAYFKTQDDAEKEESATTETICRLYDEGRSVLFISVYTHLSDIDVIRILRENNRAVTCRSDCSLKKLIKQYGDKLPEIEWATSDNKVQLNIPEEPTVVHAKPDADEMRTLALLYNHFGNVEDVVDSSNRPKEQVQYILKNAGKVVRNPALNGAPIHVPASSKTSCSKKSVVQLYLEGRAPMFISILLGTPLQEVLDTIANEKNVPLSPSNPWLSIRYLLDTYDPFTAFGFEHVYVPKQETDVILHCLLSFDKKLVSPVNNNSYLDSEEKFVLNELRANRDKYSDANSTKIITSTGREPELCLKLISDYWSDAK